MTFSASPRDGFVPFDVQFTGSSQLTVDSWTYDFGDGDSAFVQSPLHSYSTPGLYDVTLQVTAGAEIKSRTRNEYIFALADTLRGDDTTTSEFTTLVLPIYERNTIPIRQFTIPVQYTGTLDLTLDSFSTVGCRTSYFEVQDRIHSYAAGKQLTIRLVSSNSGTSPDLPAGDGLLLKLYFKTSAATVGDTTVLDLDGYNSYLPSFSSPLLTYTPLLAPPVVYVPACCVGERGDVDMSGEVNVADLTYLVNYIFNGGLPSPCEEEADIDGSGDINVADVTALVAYIFQGGAPPAACP